MVKFKCPPTYPNGSHTPFDDLVGFQLVTGGGLTLSNFEFTANIGEKTNKTFSTGVFSEPITLQDLDPVILGNKLSVAQDVGVYPNFDLSEVTSFTLYGSLKKRFEASIRKITGFFPAAMEVLSLRENYTTGYTAMNIARNNNEDETSLVVPLVQLQNPFMIEYTVNSSLNMTNREVEVSELRDFGSEYRKYALVTLDGQEYPIVDVTLPGSVDDDSMGLIVSGDPFPDMGYTLDNFIIKPLKTYCEAAFNEYFDEVEKFLLNRKILPEYTATFKVPTDSGEKKKRLTWPKRFIWNLDTVSDGFITYLKNLSDIGEAYDEYKTNLISRFLTTDVLKEFDVGNQKIEKVLQIYGRSFDEVKKFIDSLAYMNSVHYNVENDIPSKLLRNLAMTLGWVDLSVPTDQGGFNDLVFSGNLVSNNGIPDELNHQFYRNLILNTSYLFRSKGTRKSVEYLLRLIGAPDSLVEFNESVFIADSKINVTEFNNKVELLNAGELVNEYPEFDGSVHSIFGDPFSGFTTVSEVLSASVGRDSYPVDNNGFPKIPIDGPDLFFQMGAGWHESTPEHQALQTVDSSMSVFTGTSPTISTSYEQFTYGGKYLDHFRYFNYLGRGYQLYRTIDNRKSWTDLDTGKRKTSNAGYDANYDLSDERLLLNAKNMELFLNPAKAIAHEIWYSSHNYNYPIPHGILTAPYPHPGNYDWTTVEMKPKTQSFLEFASTFWKNMINVRNRLYITDGKTGGYPTLQSIFWNYIETEKNVCIPYNNFNYGNMVDYIDSIGTNWISMVEQLVPATTIWQTGTKYENTIFHRQKFVYRRQQDCQIVPTPCEPCIINEPLFVSNCSKGEYTCGIIPVFGPNASFEGGFKQILWEQVTDYLGFLGININDCIMSSLTTEWNVTITVGGVMISDVFHTGIGVSDVPDELLWRTTLASMATQLMNYGMVGYIEGDLFKVKPLGCVFTDDIAPLTIEINLDFKISCN